MNTEKDAALAPTSQPSRGECIHCGHAAHTLYCEADECQCAAGPERGKCAACNGKRWTWPATETDEIPCPDCAQRSLVKRGGAYDAEAEMKRSAQSSLPAGSLATAIEDAQRTIAGWPEDVRAAMGMQPERQGAT